MSSSSNKKQETKFKEKVYKIVQKIPSGNFLTYKQVAERAGHPKSWRAVGNVLNKNQNPKVPCHRVMTSSPPQKQWGILSLERKKYLTRAFIPAIGGTGHSRPNQ